MKVILNTIAALVITVFSVSANAVVINFIELTESTLGETAWQELSVGPAALGIKITGHATNDNDTQQFAYLDWGNAGLGVCKDASPAGAETGNTSNRCSSGAGDDNVTVGEYLVISFNQAVAVNNLWFNNNHDGGFGAGDEVTIGTIGPGGSLGNYGVQTGYAGGANGIGSFNVAADQKLKVAYGGRQFYMSGMEVSAVPVPAAIWLFGTALFGLVGISRKKRIH